MFFNKYKYYLSYFYFNSRSNEIYFYYRLINKNFFFFFINFKKWGLFYKYKYLNFFNFLKKKKKKNYKYKIFKIYSNNKMWNFNFLNYKIISKKNKYIYLTKKYLYFFIKKLNYTVVIISNNNLICLNFKNKLNCNGLILNIFLN